MPEAGWNTGRGLGYPGIQTCQVCLSSTPPSPNTWQIALFRVLDSGTGVGGGGFCCHLRHDLHTLVSKGMWYMDHVQKYSLSYTENNMRTTPMDKNMSLDVIMLCWNEYWDLFQCSQWHFNVSSFSINLTEDDTPGSLPLRFQRGCAPLAPTDTPKL